jgi:hypothetical protein
MTDPLAQFRRKPLIPTAESEPPEGPDEYVAFEAKDRVSRLRIRRVNHPTRAPGYDYLLDPMYDEPYGTNFVLHFTFMTVLVRGRNLLPVVTAIELGTADYIQQFDPARWPKPKEEKAPVIESIEIDVHENGPSVSDDELRQPHRPGSKPH